MRESTRRLRPMGIADILDETVDLYKTSFILLVGIAAVLYVPYSVFSDYFTMKYMPQVNPNANPGDVLHQIIPMLGALAISMLWMLMVSPFVTGAMTFAISERYLNRGVSVVASFRRVLSLAVFLRLLLDVVITLLLMLAIFGVIGGVIAAWIALGFRNTALLFVVVPVGLIIIAGTLFGGVYVGLRLALVNCVIVVEMKPAVDSFIRAWDLIKGHMLKYLGLIVLSSLVVGIVSSLLQQPTQSLISASMLKGGRPSEIVLIIHTLIGAVTNTVMSPVLSIVAILLYYDIRIRKEGFDLELLANELHAKSREDSAWAPQPLPQEQVTVQLPQEQVAPQFELEQIPPEEGPTAQ